MSIVRIANAQGFWGDRPAAAAELLHQDPKIDYLTLDYLAELSLSIMAIQRDRNPELGYARDFVEVVRSLVPAWKAGAGARVVSNAGGLNPHGCAAACAAALRDAGLRKSVAVVDGDNVLPLMLGSGEASMFRNLETGEQVQAVADRLVTANAYLGAEAVAEALAAGADIVITGRVADPSMVVAPCIAHFGWSTTDFDCIAGATVAGHLVECGTQLTGGISTHWLEVPDCAQMGFPIVEVAEDGSCIATKPSGTGGQVTERTVKEQLLYELGDPGRYLSPDATVSFLGITVRQQSRDRVQVSGAAGSPPPDTYKVSATYREGYLCQAMLVVYGDRAAEKARRAGQCVIDRVRHAGLSIERSLVECLGAGDAVPGVNASPGSSEAIEAVVRMAVADPSRAGPERFAKEIAPLVTSGPQGITGYATGRPDVRPVFGYWPCAVPRSKVAPRWQMLGY